MDKNHKDLVNFIGEQFSKVHTEFDKVYSEFDKVHDEFGRVHGRIDTLDHKCDGLQSDFRQLQSAVHGYAHKADTYFQEMVALSNKVNRHEK